MFEFPKITMINFNFLHASLLYFEVFKNIFRAFVPMASKFTGRYIDSGRHLPV